MSASDSRRRRPFDRLSPTALAAPLEAATSAGMVPVTWLSSINASAIPAVGLGGADACVGSTHQPDAEAHHSPQQGRAFLDHPLGRDPGVRQHLLHMWLATLAEGLVAHVGDRMPRLERRG